LALRLERQPAELTAPDNRAINTVESLSRGGPPETAHQTSATTSNNASAPPPMKIGVRFPLALGFTPGTCDGLASFTDTITLLLNRILELIERSYSTGH
jgi:hypothetical protein